VNADSDTEKSGCHRGPDTDVSGASGSVVAVSRLGGNVLVGLVKGLAVAAVVGVISVVGFYEGRKAYWDFQVWRNCKKDGGIRVYEAIELPSDAFNEWGQPNFYRPAEGEKALGEKYRIVSEKYLVRKSSPQVARYHIQIFRRSDGKLLGESISYGRGGGDLPFPSYGSSYHCPETYGDIPLLMKIFNEE